MLRPVLLIAAVAATLGTQPAVAAPFNTLSGQPPVVIAHRGASAYLPEHSLAAYELGIRMGADFIEPDLLLTKDGVLVAIHDTTLDRSTNAVELWGPGPHRVQDYTLAEIKQLTVRPTGPANSSFPGFTPSAPNAFEVPTFQEVLDFLTSYNAANGTNVGIYPEAKQPTSTPMHTQIVTQLRDAGFTSAADRVFIQSFSFGALSELADIQTALGTDMRQVALGVALETPLGYGLLNVASGEGGLFPLASLADRAQGLGVIIGDLRGFGLTNALSAEFVAAAHALGFEVHGWTFRPTTLDAASDLFGLHIAMGMDGFFTDYPDFGRIVVDAASVAPVPLPMPVALLAGALGGLFLVRRRRA